MTPEAGALLKLDSGMKWHSAYIIDGSDNIIEEVHFRKDDIALFLSARRSACDPDEMRYRCLVGDKIFLINPNCLREVAK
jgi:hypothetical protein